MGIHEHRMALIASECAPFRFHDSELLVVREPTTMTALQKDGPNHLGLRHNVLPAHQMALTTSGCVCPSAPRQSISGLAVRRCQPVPGRWAGTLRPRRRRRLLAGAGVQLVGTRFFLIKNTHVGNRLSFGVTPYGDQHRAHSCTAHAWWPISPQMEKNHDCQFSR